MLINLSFWRFILHLQMAKSGLWGHGHDIHFFHIGSFTNGSDRGLKVIILPISLMVGIVRS